MVPAFIALAAGIFLFIRGIPITIFIPFVAAGFISLFILYYRKISLRFCYLFFLLLFVAGYLITFYGENHDKKVTEKYMSHACCLTGQVDDVREYSYSTVIFLKKCTVSDVEGNDVSGETNYGGKKHAPQKRYLVSNLRVEVKDYGDVISEGDTVTVCGTFSVTDGPRNPGEFDYAGYYRSIGFGLYLDDAEVLEVKECCNVVLLLAKKIRNMLKNVYTQVCDEYDYGIFQAMVLGDKDDLNTDIKNLFSDSGIGHILAISGLHISIIGMGLYRILRKCRLSYGFSAILCGTLIVFYGIITGNPVSAVRAIIMFVCAVYANVIGRAYDILSAVCLSGILLLFKNPYYLTNCGFLLSFLAIFGITVVSRGFGNVRISIMSGRIGSVTSTILSGLVGSLSIQLATLPVMLWFYYEIPTYSCFLNILVIPLMTIVMISACLTGIVGMFSIKFSAFFVGPGHYLLLLFKKAAEFVMSLYGSVYVAGRPEEIRIVLYCILLLLFACREEVFSFFMEAKRKIIKILSGKLRDGKARDGKARNGESINGFFCKRRFAESALGLISLSLSLIVLFGKSYGNLKVVFLDVGQGDGIYIATPEGKHLFIDGGSSSKNDLYEKVVLPFLKYEGVTKLDGVFLTHNDEDHYSAWKEWFISSREKNGLKIDRLFLNEVDYANYLLLSNGDYQSTVKVGYSSVESVNGDIVTEEQVMVWDVALAVDNVDCAFAGKVYRFGSVDIISLNGSIPYSEKMSYPHAVSGSENDDSIVLMLTCEGYNMLFCGDIGQETEKIIAQRLVEIGCLPMDVLKVAHHGSRYSTSESFLDVIGAKSAIISCSEKNSYGHPHAETLERLEKEGAKILRTDESGAIIFIFPPSDGVVKEEYVN